MADRPSSDHDLIIVGAGVCRSWFTGYNANLDREDKPGYMIDAGGNPRFRQKLREEADPYPGFRFDPEPAR